MANILPSTSVIRSLQLDIPFMICLRTIVYIYIYIYVCVCILTLFVCDAIFPYGILSSKLIAQGYIEQSEE